MKKKKSLVLLPIIEAFAKGKEIQFGSLKHMPNIIFEVAGMCGSEFAVLYDKCKELHPDYNKDDGERFTYCNLYGIWIEDENLEMKLVYAHERGYDVIDKLIEHSIIQYDMIDRLDFQDVKKFRDSYIEEKIANPWSIEICTVIRSLDDSDLIVYNIDYSISCVDRKNINSN